jgi:hypothetical protein
MTKSGWQQPPVPRRPQASQCLHLGAVFAGLAVHQHTEGHVWVCTCGKEFVVVSDAGRNRHLEPWDRS